MYEENEEVYEEDDGNMTKEKGKKSFPLWIILLILILCLGMAGGGFWLFNSQKGESPTPVAQDDSWAKIQTAGVLRVATSADYPPFSYYNDNHIVDGFDAALIREIGSRLGVEVEISDYAFEKLGATIIAGQSDTVIAALSVTDEREADFDFSNIYYVSQDGILAHADSGIGQITEPSQMAGKRIGVQEFSVYQTWVQEELVNTNIISQDQLFAYSESKHAINDLALKRLDLVILDLQPATLALSNPELMLAGQGLNQQKLAIAVPNGADSLREVINQTLLDLQNEGRVDQLVEQYLGLKPEDIIPPPTAEPTVAPTETPAATETPTVCTNEIELVKDLNYDDKDLTEFPIVAPAEAFQKGWRVKNTGTCTWDDTYYLNFVRGNVPAAQMDGQPTAIEGVVEPNQEYDVYVALVAPEDVAQYVGYWQMHNTDEEAFGESITVAVEVLADPGDPTATPEGTLVGATETPVGATETPSVPVETSAPTDEPSIGEPGDDLLDATWVLGGILAKSDDENLSPPLSGTRLELIFADDGRFTGKAGCNTLSGKYTTDGTVLELSNIIALKTTCTEPAGIMEQEANFLSLLEEVEEYKIDLNMLTFIDFVDENGKEVAKDILSFSK